MFLPKKILVPIDFSACSKAALDYAIGLAKALDASIDVLTTYESPPMVAPDLMISMVGQPATTVDVWVSTEAKRSLETMLADTPRPDGLILRSHVELGNPRTAILDFAKKHLTDLIVMGTHGRTGISHFVMGSVAEGVVRGSPIPVLTIRLADPK